MAEWRHRSAGAGLVAAMLLGLREALEPPRLQPPAVIDHDEGGDDRDPVGVFLHPEVPEATLVVVRPWLLDGR